MRATVSLLLVFLTVRSAVGQTEVTAADLEQAALRARASIPRGYVEFTMTSRFSAAGQPHLQISERKTWFEGTRVRAEFRYIKGANEGVRQLQCRNCERDGWGILATDTPNEVTEFHPLVGSKRPPLREAVDPRQFGYYPSIYVTLADLPLAKLFDSNGLRTVKRREANGGAYYEIRWAKTEKTGIIVWIDPDRGSNVTRIESVTRSGQSVQKAVMTSELAQTGGVWFPKRVVLKSLWNEEVTSEETLDVHIFRPNDTPPAGLFTLGGCELKPNEYVLTPDPSQNGILRNGRIVPRSEEPPPPSQPTDVPPLSLSPPSRLVDPWFAAACAACAVGVVAVVLVRRRS